jgi:hypothetical protein
MAKRQCQGKTKAGKPCKAAPLSGSDYCSAHDPSLPDETRFGSPIQASDAGKLGGPATRRPRVIEKMRERVEADIELVLKPYFEALEAKLMTTVFSAEDGVLTVMTDVPDLEMRMKAADKLLDRVYGKPRQQMEHSGPDKGGIPLELDAEGSKAAHDFLARIGRT